MSAPVTPAAAPQAASLGDVLGAMLDARFRTLASFSAEVLLMHRGDRFAVCIPHDRGWSVYIRDGAAPLYQSGRFVYNVDAVVAAALEEIPAPAPVSVSPAREGVDP